MIINPISYLSLGTQISKSIKISKLFTIVASSIKFLPAILPNMMNGIDISSPEKCATSIIIKKCNTEQNTETKREENTFSSELDAKLVCAELASRRSEIMSLESKYHPLSPILDLSEDIQIKWIVNALMNYQIIRNIISKEVVESADSDKLFQCVIVQLYYQHVNAKQKKGDEKMNE